MFNRVSFWFSCFPVKSYMSSIFMIFMILVPKHYGVTSINHEVIRCLLSSIPHFICSAPGCFYVISGLLSNFKQMMKLTNASNTLHFSILLPLFMTFQLKTLWCVSVYTFLLLVQKPNAGQVRLIIEVFKSNTMPSPDGGSASRKDLYLKKKTFTRHRHSCPQREFFYILLYSVHTLSVFVCLDCSAFFLFCFHTTNIPTLGGIWTRNPSKRPAADPHLSSATGICVLRYVAWNPIFKEANFTPAVNSTNWLTEIVLC
jgi:hypothetical protein